MDVELPMKRPLALLLLVVFLGAALVGVLLTGTRVPVQLRFQGYTRLTNGAIAAEFRVSNARTRRVTLLSRYLIEEETVDGWFRNWGARGSWHSEDVGKGIEFRLPEDGRRRRITFHFLEHRPRLPTWVRWDWLQRMLRVYFGNRVFSLQSEELVAGDPHRPGLQLARQRTEQFREARRRSIQAILDYGGFIHWDKNGLVKWISLVYDESEGHRIECTNRSDQIAAELEHLPEVREMLLTGGQATDSAMQHVGKLIELEALYMWGARVTDLGVTCLANLHCLKEVDISNAGITDASLGVLSTLPALEEMSLQQNRFTDAGLKHLVGMTQLRKLFLGIAAPEITDTGMTYLTGLTNLQVLDLQGTSVTDAGLTQLETLQELEEVWLEGSQVTQAGVERLHGAIPGLKIRQ